MMLKLSERTDSWNNMMLAPGKTAKLHAKRKELGFRDGLENFGTPIFMTYLPLALLALMVSGNLESIFLAVVLFSITATAFGIFVASFLFAFMAHSIASFFGGKAALSRVYYMTSLAAAPTFVFTIVINIAMLLAKGILNAISFPFAAIGVLQLGGTVVAVSVTIYGCYLMTVSLDALYKFGMKKSLLSWLAPMTIIIIACAYLFETGVFGVLSFLLRTL